MRLEAKLEEWVEHGLLEQEAADRILAYEGSEPQRTWVMFGIVGVGIVALMTGVISVVAANWQELSDGVKLTSYFLIQSFLGIAFLKVASRQGLIREALLTIFCLFIFAGIGLAGQIYHLKSDGWQAILFWLSMTFPAVLIARSRLLNHLWFAALLIALIIWFRASTGGSLNEFLRVCRLFTIGFFVAALGFTPFPNFPRYFRSAARIWSLTTLLIFLSVSANILFSHRPSNIAHWFSYSALIEPSAALLIALIAIWTGSKKESQSAKMLSLMLLSAWIAFCLPWFFLALNSEILGCLAFLVPWSFAAAAAGFAKRRRLFECCTFVIATRLVVVYFQVFGSLMATGFGLIFSGLVIIGAAVLWQRYSKRLAIRLGMRT